MEQTTAEEAKELALQIGEAMGAGRFDEVAALWERLTAALPALKGNPTLPVLVALREGRANDALHLVNDFPEDQWPQLRAMCLHALGDPQWERYAQAADEIDDPYVRRAMQHLRGQVQDQGA